jgi:hypothetical protein
MANWIQKSRVIHFRCSPASHAILVGSLGAGRTFSIAAICEGNSVYICSAFMLGRLDFKFSLWRIQTGDGVS